MTKALKEMILGALDRVGGEEYLAGLAKEHPAGGGTLLGKVLPTTLAGDKDAPLFPAVSTADLEERAIAKLVAAGVSRERAEEIVREGTVH